jgi:DNA polymerase I-like protein with 3'-5' exonuclease and polymerase domains
MRLQLSLRMGLLMVQVSPFELIEKAWMSSYIAVDTEGTDIKTTDLRDGTGFAYGVSVACRPPLGDRPIYSAYFPLAHTRDNVDKETRAQLKALVEIHKRVIYHNSKHDIPALRTVDIERSTNFYDTMLMCHWCFEQYTWSGFSLDWCVKKFLDGDDGKKNKGAFEALLAFFGWTPDFPAKEMGEYAAYDTELTLRLFEFVYPIFKREGFDG